MQEGLCHQCKQFIPLLSVKNVDAVVPELIWFRVCLSPCSCSTDRPQHAKRCHGSSHQDGEGDVFVKDAVYRLATSDPLPQNM